MEVSLQEKLPLMEGTNQPCKMARQGVSTAREERRDMGVKERRVEAKRRIRKQLCRRF